jgi:hypothetical protein
MRPVIASESARRYEMVIFGIRQSPAGILTCRPLTAAADGRDRSGLPWRAKCCQGQLFVCGGTATDAGGDFPAFIREGLRPLRVGIVAKQPLL